MLVRVSGLKMGSVIGGKDDHSVVVKSLFFQTVHKSSEILVKTCALTEIVRIFFGGIAL